MNVTADGNGSITFPVAPASVHYIMRKVTGADGRSAIRFRYNVQGDQPFVSDQDGGACQVTLIVQRVGDTLTADKPSYRFWSGSTAVAAGDYTLEVPLTADRWTNVFGQRDDYSFGGVIGNLDNVGFTFGNPGAGATGHGCHTSGAASFTVLEYAIEGP